MNAISPIHHTMLAGLSKLHYRRIIGGRALDEVGELRQRAYDARPIYKNKFRDPVVEDFDSDPNNYLFGLYEGEALLATVRIGVLHKGNPITPASKMFSSNLAPLIDQGHSFIDPSRLAVDPSADEVFPALPICVLRTALIATTHFSTNQCLSVIKREHEGFYRRVFRSTRLAGPVRPPGHMIDVVLLGSVRENTRKIQDRYPIFNFSKEESDALFADLPAGQMVSEPIQASAAQVVGLDQSDMVDVDRYKVA